MSKLFLLPVFIVTTLIVFQQHSKRSLDRALRD
jgi:hypothetical protein